MKPCCCCTTRTGGQIIAILEIIGGIAGIVVAVLTLTVLAVASNPNLNVTLTINGEETTIPFNAPTTMKIPTNQTRITTTTTVDAKQKKFIEEVHLFRVLLYLGILLFTVEVIFAVFLIVGIKKSSVSFMKTWVAFKLVSVVFSVGLVISSFFTANVGSKSTYYDGIDILLSFYFIWVIVALIQETQQNLRTRVKPSYQF